MNTTAILTAIEEVCTGALGSVRTVAPGTLTQGGVRGLSDEAAFADALVKTRFDVELPTPNRSDIIAPQNANLEVLEIYPTILLTHTTEVEIVVSAQRTVKARAADDATAVRRALSWPGNLAQTSGAVATGIVSAALVLLAEPEVIRADWAARIYQTQLRFKGWVQDSVPVS